MPRNPDFNVETLSKVFASCGPETAKIMKSIMSEYEAQLRDGFVARARARGFTKGRRDGLCEALLRILEKVFGSVEHEYRNRAAKAEAKEILGWIRRVVQGRCLDAALRIESAPDGDSGSAFQGMRTPNGELFSEFRQVSSWDTSSPGQENDDDLAVCKERQVEHCLDLWDQGTLQDEDSHAARIFAECAKQDVAALEAHGQFDGVLCGLQDSVLLTLECRFGVVEHKYRRKLAKAGVEMLRLWVTEAMRVESVERLLGKGKNLS